MLFCLGSLIPQTPGLKIIEMEKKKKMVAGVRVGTSLSVRKNKWTHDYKRSISGTLILVCVVWYFDYGDRYMTLDI